MTRASPIVCCLFVAVAGCGRVPLDQFVASAPDAAAPDARATSADAGDDRRAMTGPPFALVVRMTNRTDGDVYMEFRPSVCADDIFIQGGAPVEQPTTIQTLDYFCDCTDCSASNGRPRCTSTDFICDQPPLVLHPGEHMDFPWDGIVQLWLQSPSAGSGCLGRCSAFVPVPAGDYTFTLAQSQRVVSVVSPVPPPGGVVHIPIDSP